MSTTHFDFSTGLMHLTFHAADGHLRLDQFSFDGFSWLDPGSPSGLFGVTAGGAAWNAANLAFDHASDEREDNGARRVGLVFNGPGMTVEQTIRLYGDAALLELCPVIRNSGARPLRVERVDTLMLALPDASAELLSFHGDWGSEFEPGRGPLTGTVTLESRSGRSSKGNHPWFALFNGAGQVLSGAVAWSGNWVLRFEPPDEGRSGYRLSGGLHDWEFCKTLQPGESMQGAPVILTLGHNLNAVSQQYARVGRHYWYPRNALAARLPVEWNHWWSYEDVDIHESVFADNARAAREMGLEACTLDAGWFGPSDAQTFWGRYRGDWDRVNAQRFPGSIRKLADQVHALGLKFGIWCEIEGLGDDARVAVEHPEFVAARDGQRLGYVCLGSPQAQAWAYQTLARLITEYQADWIKLDFNLDPGAGCNRADHGHQAGDGLYAHYQGYYRTLERVRRDFPDVVLENCSSGGLRIDLGMLRRTDMTFLSDPDWPVHDLQIFWGASTMLAPERLLHWTYSHWRMETPPPYQSFNPHDPNLTVKKWDYYARISMLGWYGLSQKLPDLPAWLAKRIAEHTAIYQAHVRRFVREGDLYRLTDQPLRSGAGERWAAFQYSLPDRSEHLLFVFRLPGAEPARAIHLQGLDPERLYALQGFEGEWDLRMTGRALMADGLVFSTLDEEESALIRLG